MYEGEIIRAAGPLRQAIDLNNPRLLQVEEKNTTIGYLNKFLIHKNIKCCFVYFSHILYVVRKVIFTTISHFQICLEQ